MCYLLKKDSASRSLTYYQAMSFATVKENHHGNAQYSLRRWSGWENVTTLLSEELPAILSAQYLVYWRDGGKSRLSSQYSSCSCRSTKRKLLDEWMRSVFVILICPLISKIYIMQICTFGYDRKIETFFFLPEIRWLLLCDCNTFWVHVYCLQKKEAELLTC